MMTDTPEAYWQREWQPYATQICLPLSQVFGSDFVIADTGGGCKGIATTFENGDELLITDAQDILSPWPQRQRRWDNDREALGYMVGYYELPDGSCGEGLCYVRFQKARDAYALTIAIKAAIGLAKHVRAGLMERGTKLEL